MNFHRPIGDGDNFSSTGSSSNSILKEVCNGLLVPRIDISIQTLIDGSDVGEIIFVISDKFTYYSNNPIELNVKICTIDCIPVENLKETIFKKECPKMVSVFIGEGEFLYTKVENI